jgi:Tol biopolymer transport system component
MDIFTIDREGAYQRVTDSGAYEFHPSFSPDGRYLAFISDRDTCPSWIPGEPNTCDGTDTPPPVGGSVYVLELATGIVTRVSDAYVTDPPRWINPRQLTFASTDRLSDPLLGGSTRELWRVDVVSGDTRRVTLQSNDAPLKLAEAWSPDGQQVIFQAVGGSSTDIVLAQFNGVELGRISDLAFARYAMVAAWSPDGQRIAIGGVSGQCPYGIVVTDTSLGRVARGNPPPTMCNPAFSPDGRWIAFDGVTPRVDGRIDVWVANNNGFGGAILTGALRGQIEFLGWVGG